MVTMLVVLGLVFGVDYAVMAVIAVKYVKRVTWKQSIIWPYYFCSDMFGKGFDKRPIK